MMMTPPAMVVNTVFAVGRRARDSRRVYGDSAIGWNAIQGQVAKLGRTLQAMRMKNKWQTTLRVENIRREIVEIQAANQIYKAHVKHTVAQIADHEKRQRRLQEIMGELKTLSGQSPARVTD